MNLVLLLLTLIILTASGVYVLMQDWRAAANRLLALFALNGMALTCAASVRLTSNSLQEIWFVSGLLAPLLSSSFGLLIWLILAIFIPHRYAQPSVRWSLAAPYLLMTSLLVLDWYGGADIVARHVVRNDAGTVAFTPGPAFVPVMILFTIGVVIVPLTFLITIAIRHRRMRGPALWLIGGAALSYMMGFTFRSQAISVPELSYASLFPLQLAFGWVTLRYQVFRPSTVALRTAIEHLQDGIVLLDAQRCVRFANRAAQRLAPLLASGGASPPFDEALTRAGFVESTTADDHLNRWRRFNRDGEAAVTLLVSETSIEGDRESAGVALLRDMTTVERQKAALMMSQAMLEERTAALERSLEEIRQRDILITRLTLPLIPLGNGVVVMPLIGAFDGGRCKELVSMLLNYIEERSARTVLLDLTGVTGFDEALATALRQATDGARLMGAQIALCGVRPDIAESIVHERIHLNGVRHFATMQEGVAALLHPDVKGVWHADRR